MILVLLDIVITSKWLSSLWIPLLKNLKFNWKNCWGVVAHTVCMPRPALHHQVEGHSLSAFKCFNHESNRTKKGVNRAMYEMTQFLAVFNEIHPSPKYWVMSGKCDGVAIADTCFHSCEIVTDNGIKTMWHWHFVDGCLGKRDDSSSDKIRLEHFQLRRFGRHWMLPCNLLHQSVQWKGDICT